MSACVTVQLVSVRVTVLWKYVYHCSGYNFEMEFWCVCLRVCMCTGGYSRGCVFGCGLLRSRSVGIHFFWTFWWSLQCHGSCFCWCLCLRLFPCWMSEPAYLFVIVCLFVPVSVWGAWYVVYIIAIELPGWMHSYIMCQACHAYFVRCSCALNCYLSPLALSFDRCCFVCFFIPFPSLPSLSSPPVNL